MWDWDRFGRNQFLGEVRLPLASLDLTDARERWYTLQDKVWIKGWGKEGEGQREKEEEGREEGGGKEGNMMEGYRRERVRWSTGKGNWEMIGEMQ